MNNLYKLILLLLFISLPCLGRDINRPLVYHQPETRERLTALIGPMWEYSFKGMRVNVTVYYSEQINAAASWPINTIFISSAAYNTLPDGELIAIIGHEIGHLKYRQLSVDSKYTQQIYEAAADEYMMDMLDDMGYSCQETYLALFKRFYKEDGGGIFSNTTHPSSLYRYLRAKHRCLNKPN